MTQAPFSPLSIRFKTCSLLKHLLASAPSGPVDTDPLLTEKGYWTRATIPQFTCWEAGPNFSACVPGRCSSFCSGPNAVTCVGPHGCPSSSPLLLCSSLCWDSQPLAHLSLLCCILLVQPFFSLLSVSFQGQTSSRRVFNLMRPLCPFLHSLFLWLFSTILD